MFETDLFKYDFDLVPEIASLFAKMEVKHEPLTLIVPQFETPLLGTPSPTQASPPASSRPC
jgi:intraflagellar transport protein 52